MYADCVLLGVLHRPGLLVFQRIHSLGVVVDSLRSRLHADLDSVLCSRTPHNPGHNATRDSTQLRSRRKPVINITKEST